MNTNSAAVAQEQCSPEPQDNCDQTLVSAAMDGDLAAFSALCRLHSPRLFRSIRQITRNREDAEDALQDAFLRAFVHLRSFDGRAQFSTWLTRIAINSALMLLRKRKNYAGISIDSTPQDQDRSPAWEIPDTADDPECCLLNSETQGWLRQAIDNLDPTYRVAIELRNIRELSNKEGARLLRISPAAYKSRLARAKAALRAEFAVVNETRNVVQQPSNSAPGGLSV